MRCWERGCRWCGFISSERSALSRAGERTAFTLVELLIVIGIIAVLIGVLLPALGKAREAANTVRCSANMRSIGQGLATYLAMSKGTFPAAKSR